MSKYYECWKCGESVSTTEGTLCAMPMSFRTSGICGGSCTNELSEEEFNNKWKEIIDKNENFE